MNRITRILFACVALMFLGGSSVAQPQSWGRATALTVKGDGTARLTLFDGAATGISFTNVLHIERHLTNQILLNGSGVTAGDVDGDGLVDVFFAGLGGGARLYRNLGGWKFEDSTERVAGLPPGLEMSGVCFADLDGDGDLDLMANSVNGGTRLLLNDGRGRFAPGPELLNPRRGGTSLAFADMDGDGDLDGYIANYRTVTIRDQPNTAFSIREVQGRHQVVSVGGVPVSDPELTNRFVFRITAQGGRGNMAYDENGEADVLLRNEGGGRFVPVPFTGGAFLDEAGEALAAPPFDWGLSAAFRDVNGDGAPDLYVCNDFRSPDRLWLNDGRGRFRAAPVLAIRQTSLSSMGVDFADVNRDGRDDLFVVDMLSRQQQHRMAQRIDIRPEVLPPGTIDPRMQTPRNTLLLGRGDGTFAEAANWSGLAATEWSWTPAFLDVDLDGHEDLLVSNGFERDGMNVDALREIEMAKRERKLTSLEQLSLRRRFPRLATANLAFRNSGNGTFADASAAWGFDAPAVSQGMCLADLDNDGDLDVLVNNMNGPAFVYRNDAPAPRLAVRLNGRAPNTRGVGARIRVFGGPVPEQSQEMMCGGRYLSSDDAIRTFAAGPGPMRVEVKWRSGRVTIAEGVRANHLLVIDEAAAMDRPSSTNAPVAPLFTDLSERLNHRHVEEPFDDFTSQPTLSRRLSQLGPGICWFDVDGDGWEDLLVGSGKGGQMAWLRNDAKGGFARRNEEPFTQLIARDQTGLVAWRDGAGRTFALAGSANYEDGSTNGGGARLYDLAARRVEDFPVVAAASTGPLAMADIDGNGELDVFVGGRVQAGKFPQAASSQIFRWQAGRFVRDEVNSRLLEGVGMVAGAVFSDLDGDGDADLIVACDWGALKCFQNTAGKLVAWDWEVKGANVERSVLSQLTGWWNSVTTGDFDGDGRMDIIAGNAGRNTFHEAFRAAPLRLYHGALGTDGAEQCIEAYEEPGTRRWLPLQPFHVMGVAMPVMRERVGSFEKYARSTVQEIYGAALDSARVLSASHFDTSLFLNRGDHFLAVPLPVETQLSPVFAVCVADADGDGAEDVFLGQNLFAVHPEHSRMDAGRGLLLKGDGRGGFVALSGDVSGVKIYGEQRGAAWCDYDADGRVDLAVSQNAAATKLYRNTAGRPGLRVRLRGDVGNGDAIGAVLRVKSGGRLGPAREVHAGAGYWSQDSAVQVVAVGEGPAELHVRWPGGKIAVHLVPTGAREVIVRASGGLERVR